MLGNLRTRFTCDSELKKGKGTIIVTFDTIPYAVDMIEKKPITSVLTKEYGGLGSLSLTFKLNKDEMLKDRVVNHVTKKFDITELNLAGLRRIGTTVYLLCPDPDDPNLESIDSESTVSDDNDVVNVSQGKDGGDDD